MDRITKKKIAAVQRIIMNAKGFDPMLSGEIPVDNGIIITDGLSLLFSPASFEMSKCLSLHMTKVGGVLKSKLLAACKADKVPVANPFELNKVASTLRELCKEHGTTNEYKQSFIIFDGAVFNVKQVINLFDVVGKRAVGYISKPSDLFGGHAYMIVEPKDCDYENDIYGILLQSRKAGD